MSHERTRRGRPPLVRPPLHCKRCGRRAPDWLREPDAALLTGRDDYDTLPEHERGWRGHPHPSVGLVCPSCWTAEHEDDAE